LADINLMPYIARLDYLQLLEPWIADRPLTQKWWHRVQLIPEFIKSIQKPMLESEITDMKHYGQLIEPSIRAIRLQLAS